jgi:hypothetical protein
MTRRHTCWSTFWATTPPRCASAWPTSTGGPDAARMPTLFIGGPACMAAGEACMVSRQSKQTCHMVVVQAVADTSCQKRGSVRQVQCAAGGSGEGRRRRAGDVQAPAQRVAGRGRPVPRRRGRRLPARSRQVWPLSASSLRVPSVLARLPMSTPALQCATCFLRNSGLSSDVSCQVVHSAIRVCRCLLQEPAQGS